MPERRSEHLKTTEISDLGLLQIDTAVFNLFSIKKPLVIKGKKTPVIFGSWERFAQMQGNKEDDKLNEIRDHKGMLILPIISIRRGDITPNERRYVHIDNDSNPSIVFTKKIADSNFDINRRIPFKEKWKFGDYYKKDNPVYETHRLPIPSFIDVSYYITLWASYVKDTNKFQDSIWKKYIINDLEYDGFFMYSKFTGVSDESNIEDFSTEERILKYSFTLDVQGYLLDKSQVQIERTISKIILEEKIVDIPDEVVGIDGVVEFYMR